MKYLISSVFFSFIMLTTFAQLQPKQNYPKYFKEDCIPKDIKNDSLILIVRTPYNENQEKKNEEIRQLFETYYKNKFLIVPNVSKDFQNKVYADTRIYKYSVAMLRYTEADGAVNNNNIDAGYYKLSIIDNSRLNKNNVAIDPKNKNKKINLDDFDLTAIKATGLDDRESRIINMLTYLAQRLGDYK